MPYRETAKSMGGRLENLGVAAHVKEYSSFASEIDLSSACPPGSHAAAAWMVTVAGGNAVQVECADGSVETYDTTNLVGVRIDGAIRAIKTGTTVAKLLVFFV